jgi:predicted permease
MPLENWRYTLPLRIRSLFRRTEVERELDEEMQYHLDRRIQDEVSRGASEEEARRAALRAMEGLTLRKEQCREARRVNLIDNLLQDVRYGLRQMRHNPGFTIVAVLSLALGIGGNTAIFQLIDAVRLRTLPVRGPQELYTIDYDGKAFRSGSSNSRSARFTFLQWQQIGAQQQAFTDLLAWSGTRFNLAPAGEVRFAQGLYVSGGFFRHLGVAPVLGRLIDEDDDRHGCSNPIVVLSYAFWQREFAGEGSALGRHLTLDGRTFSVIGVTPPSFFGPEAGWRFDVAVPLCADTLMAEDGKGRIPDATWWWLSMMGRLKPGWTPERAKAHLKAISPAVFEATLPASYRPQTAERYLANKLTAIPAGTGVSALRKQFEEPLWLLLATTGFILLIACANLANLLLARASAREREIAVRLAIGSSRTRLIRQFLTESFLLAIAGSVLGGSLAQVMSRVLVSFLATRDDGVFVDLHWDARMLVFLAAGTVATCVLFGLVPALRATRLALDQALRAGGRSVSDGRERFGLRRALVAAQVALSLVLLFGALLFAGSLQRLLAVDPGFRSESILGIDLDFSQLHYNNEQLATLRRTLFARVSAQPGILSAAEVAVLPISGSRWNDIVHRRGSPPGESDKHSMFNRVSPGYFRTMGTQLIAGRDFDARDNSTSPRVAIVNQSFARQVFGAANPVGQVFGTQQDAGQPDSFYEVVGLAADSKYASLREDPEPIAYLAADQLEHPTDSETSFVLKSGAPLGVTIRILPSVIHGIHPGIQYRFQVLADNIRESLVRERLMATLSGIFGLLAGVLAMLGLYGVMSYIVARRRHEIGLRLALGAERGGVVLLVLREAAQFVGAGLIAGAALALFLARAAEALLFGLKPWDPFTLGASIALLALVAITAAWLPARRAASMDPMKALRQD